MLDISICRANQRNWRKPFFLPFAFKTKTTDVQARTQMKKHIIGPSTEFSQSGKRCLHKSSIKLPLQEQRAWYLPVLQPVEQLAEQLAQLQGSICWYMWCMYNENTREVNVTVYVIQLASFTTVGYCWHLGQMTASHSAVEDKQAAKGLIKPNQKISIQTILFATYLHTFALLNAAKGCKGMQRFAYHGYCT